MKFWFYGYLETRKIGIETRKKTALTDQTTEIVEKKKKKKIDVVQNQKMNSLIEL